jgi:hypothetical protein
VVFVADGFLALQGTFEKICLQRFIRQSHLELNDFLPQGSDRRTVHYRTGPLLA